MQNENSVKVKASYFYSKKLAAHIKTKPTGGFDCFFVSDLIDGVYYKVHKINPYTGEPLDTGRDELFLIDIFDIKIFERRIEQ